MSSRAAHIALMLPRFSRYGGVEQFGYRLAEALAARGHAVTFICARQEVDAPPGVRIVCTGRPLGPRWLKMLRFACKAESLRQRGGYDCTISLGKTLYQDIMRVGGGPLREFWRYSELAYPKGLPRLLKQTQRMLSLDSLLTLWLEKRQYARTKTIVPVSHFVRDLIVTAHPEVQPAAFRIIYNKPDLSRFSPPTCEEKKNARSTFGIPEGCTAIGLATSNFQLKGTGPLIRALPLLPEKCTLVVAGARGHSAYDALARDLGLKNRVLFLGKVDAMPVWYKALDVFALPSFYDACSNAVLEALASGLPVLSSAANGSSYFLPPENVVQNPGDSAALAKILTRLIAPAGNGATATAQAAFAWPDHVAAGMDAFVALVEEHLEAPARLL